MSQLTGTGVRVVASIDELGPAEWERLAGRAPVFYRYDFLRSVETSPLSRPSAAHYLVTEDASGRLAAAMVLYLQETVDPFATGGDGRPERMLTGHVWHCYDTVVLSAAPLAPAVVTAFCDAMHALADELGAGPRGLVNVAWGGPLAAALTAAGLPAQETTPRYRLTVPPGGITREAHLATVGRSSRRTLGRYWRRALRAGVRVRFDEGRRVLDDEVLELCRATADKHAPGYYPPVELSALIDRLGPACRLLRVELDGVLLAVSICLLDEGRAHFWAGGCRYPAELNWSPQYVLFAAELEAGLASGRPVVEFGRRNDEFKRRYGLAPVRLGRFVSGGAR